MNFLKIQPLNSYRVEAVIILIHFVDTMMYTNLLLLVSSHPRLDFRVEFVEFIGRESDKGEVMSFFQLVSCFLVP